MKVAIPIFGKSVAPRFGFADQFLIASISEGQVESKTITVSDNASWHCRLSELEIIGVKVLLCGGFNRRFEPYAEDLGIKVIAGLAGDASVLIQTYARGERLNVISGRRRRGEQNGHWSKRQRGRKKNRKETKMRFKN